MNVAAMLEREASYAYDKNGNVTEVGTTTFYTYDFDNRLTQSSIWNGTGTTTTTYAYDPFGNCISQTASTTTTLYPSKYFSLTTTTTGTSTVATSTDYLYSGSSLLATIDQKLVNGSATGTAITRYNHPDNLGSTNVTSDTSGNWSQWLDYAPFGSVLASENTGTTTAARQYIGQFSDASGLSYLNARYYQPAQEQFLTEDPIFLANPSQQSLGDPQSLNSYSYSEDNPIVKSDPNGKQLEGLAASYGTGYFLGGETGPFDIVVGTAIGTALFFAANSSPMTYEPTAPGYPQAFQESIGQGYNTDPEFGGDLPPGWWGRVIKTGLVLGGTATALKEGGWTDLMAAFGGSYASPQVSTGAVSELPSPEMATNLGQYFPSAVSQNGENYYRNSRGLLSSTPQSSQTSSSESSSGGGGSSSQSQQGYNVLPGQFNPVIPH